MVTIPLNTLHLNPGKMKDKKLHYYYCFAEEPPQSLQFTTPFFQYFKANFTWLVKQDIHGNYFHYTRMPSGRIMYRISLLPF